MKHDAPHGFNFGHPSPRALSPFVKDDGEREVTSLSPSFTGRGVG